MLETLQGKRQEKRLYGTTVLFKNTQQQTCFYDKVLEMELKGGCSIDLPDTLRAEYRLLNAKKVKTVLNYEDGTVRELLDCWNKLNIQYTDHIQTGIMQYEPADYIQLLSSELERDFIQAFKEGGYWLNSYMKEQGYRNLLKEQTQQGVLRAYKRTLERKEQGNIKEKVYRLKKRLQQYGMKLILSSETEHNTTYKSLYKELKEKLTTA